MFGWIGSLRRSPPRRPAASTSTAAARVRAQETAPLHTPSPDAASALSRLLDGPPPLPTPATAREQQLLQGLAGVIAARCQTGQTGQTDELLPRAAGVLPQLLALMRQPAPSRTAMVQQLTKDALLTAEVLRMARSPFYGGQPVTTIESALDRIGTSGLQAATARVLLKPVFQPQGTGLAARAAPRLWPRSERKSLQCAEHLARQGGERFEGSLAGLLHDSGWLALLRLLDRSALALELPFSQALDAALDRHKDRLFAQLLAGWALSPALDTLAAGLQRQPLAALDLPLARALWSADQAGAADTAR